MRTNELRIFQPTPHPLKGIFKECKYNQFKIAKSIGETSGNVWKILNGYCQPTDEVETKLKRLADMLDEPPQKRKPKF